MTMRSSLSSSPVAPLLYLPSEILLQILQHIPISTLHALRLLSHDWNNFINTNEHFIYHAAAVLHSFVQPGLTLEQACTVAREGDGGGKRRWLEGVADWKELCQRFFALERNWECRPPTPLPSHRVTPSPFGLNYQATWSEPREGIVPGTGRDVHRFKVDEEHRFAITTHISGGLTVSSLDENAIIFSLSDRYVRRLAHCEYSNGYVIFDRLSPHSLEVWRLETPEWCSKFATPPGQAPPTSSPSSPATLSPVGLATRLAGGASTRATLVPPPIPNTPATRLMPHSSQYEALQRHTYRARPRPQPLSSVPTPAPRSPISPLSPFATPPSSSPSSRLSPLSSAAPSPSAPSPAPLPGPSPRERTGAFAPWALLTFPAHARTTAYRFVYPTLLVAAYNCKTLFLFDIPSAVCVDEVKLGDWGWFRGGSVNGDGNVVDMGLDGGSQGNGNAGMGVGGNNGHAGVGGVGVGAAAGVNHGPGHDPDGDDEPFIAYVELSARHIFVCTSRGLLIITRDLEREAKKLQEEYRRPLNGSKNNSGLTSENGMTMGSSGGDVGDAMDEDSTPVLPSRHFITTFPSPTMGMHLHDAVLQRDTAWQVFIARPASSTSPSSPSSSSGPLSPGINTNSNTNIRTRSPRPSFSSGGSFSAGFEAVTKKMILAPLERRVPPNTVLASVTSRQNFTAVHTSPHGKHFAAINWNGVLFLVRNFERVLKRQISWLDATVRINLDSPAMHLAFGTGSDGPQGRAMPFDDEVEEGGRVAVQTRKAIYIVNFDASFHAVFPFSRTQLVSYLPYRVQAMPSIFVAHHPAPVVYPPDPPGVNVPVPPNPPAPTNPPPPPVPQNPPAPQNPPVSHNPPVPQNPPAMPNPPVITSTPPAPPNPPPAPHPPATPNPPAPPPVEVEPESPPNLTFVFNPPSSPLTFEFIDSSASLSLPSTSTSASSSTSISTTPSVSTSTTPSPLRIPQPITTTIASPPGPAPTPPVPMPAVPPAPASAVHIPHIPTPTPHIPTPTLAPPTPVIPTPAPAPTPHIPALHTPAVHAPTPHTPILPPPTTAPNNINNNRNTSMNNARNANSNFNRRRPIPRPTQPMMSTALPHLSIQCLSHFIKPTELVHVSCIQLTQTTFYVNWSPGTLKDAIAVSKGGMARWTPGTGTGIGAGVVVPPAPPQAGLTATAAIAAVANMAAGTAEHMPVWTPMGDESTGDWIDRRSVCFVDFSPSNNMVSP